MNKKTKIQENKAITLIALVITIIVLIILAGVAINLTLGQNGLFARAKQASENYRIAKEKEELQLEIADIQTQTIKEEGRVATLQDLYNKIDKIKFAIEISNDEIADIDSTIVNPTYAVVNKIESNIYFTVDKKLEIIKVEVKGKTTQKAEIVKVSNIIWENGKVTVELTTKETGTIEYKVGEDGIYQTGTTINNLKHGDIVYTRVNNNGTYTEEETKEIKDTIEPEEFKIEASDITTDSIKISGSTQDNQTGLATYSYVVATKTNVIVQEIAGQTVTEYTITGLESGTEYIVYMLAYDNAGNVRKSNEVSIKTLIQETGIYGKIYADGIFTLSSRNDAILEGKTITKEYENQLEKLKTSQRPDWYTKDRNYIENNVNQIIILDEIVSTSYYALFNDFTSCTKIENIQNINTSITTDMREMFQHCWKLEELDLSTFDTSNATDMTNMFYNCRKLLKVNLSTFETCNVINMSYMFSGCSLLQILDLSKFNTSNVTNMSSMFNGCSALQALDVTDFNTSKVMSMSGMFSGCKFTSIDLSKFDTSSVINMSSMFQNCENLTSIDLSNFDTQSVSEMNAMFYNCKSLISLDLTSFNMKKIEYTDQMFYEAKNLKEIKVKRSNWKTGTKSSKNMFTNCGVSSVTYID